MKFKKLNLIIGKRQIIIVSLLVTLSVAAFLNWQFATGDQSVTVMENGTNKTENNTKLGEAELVQNQNISNNISNATKSPLQQLRITKNMREEEEKNNFQELMKTNTLTQEQKNKISENQLKSENDTREAQKIDDQLKLNKKAGIKRSVSFPQYTKNNTTNKTEKKYTIYVEPSGNRITDENLITMKDIITQIAGVKPQNITIIPIDNSDTVNAKT